tara:strand:+ start:14077 stop:14532 length:456 start_codon:yes stop_codon:yes gene_type:complete
MKGNKHHRIVKKFSELSLDDLYKIIQLRIDVFVVEQDCPYSDLDDKDQNATHLYYETEEGEIIGYIRILDKGVSYKEIAIGRVIIKESCRKYKLGHQLMQDGIDYIRSLGETEIRISAQEHLREFYERLGFEKMGGMYLEDNIPHIQMFKA